MVVRPIVLPAPDEIRFTASCVSLLRSSSANFTRNRICSPLGEPGLGDASEEDLRSVLASRTAMGVPWVEAQDIAHALLWLASDEARYVTGVTLPVTAGTYGTMN